MLAVRCV